MGSWRMRASVPNRSATKPSHNGKGAMAYMNPPPRASRRARRPKYGLWGRGLHGGGHFPWLRRRMAALEAAAARLGWRNGGMGHSAALYLGCGSCGTHDTTTTGTRPTNVRHDQHTPGRTRYDVYGGGHSPSARSSPTMGRAGATRRRGGRARARPPRSGPPRARRWAARACRASPRGGGVPPASPPRGERDDGRHDDADDGDDGDDERADRRDDERQRRRLRRRRRRRSDTGDGDDGGD